MVPIWKPVDELVWGGQWQLANFSTIDRQQMQILREEVCIGKVFAIAGDGLRVYAVLWRVGCQLPLRQFMFLIRTGCGMKPKPQPGSNHGHRQSSNRPEPGYLPRLFI